MGFHHGRLLSAQDIRERCQVEDTFTYPDGTTKKRLMSYCDHRSESIEAFGQYRNPDWQSNHSSEGLHNGLDWHGTNSYAEAVDLCRNGWPGGTERMRKLTLKLTPKLPTGQKRQVKYRHTVAPHGIMMIDPVALRLGSPAPFIGRFNTNQRVQGQKIIKIGFNMTISGATETEVIEGRGAATLALIDVLQRLGKEVDLTVFYCVTAGYNPSTPWLGQWNIKPAGHRANMDQMAFALVNNAGFRRMMFAMAEHVPGPYCKGLYSGYGYPQPVAKLFPDVAAKFDILVDSDVWDGSSRWTKVDAQVEWVKEQLRSQGIDC